MVLELNIVTPEGLVYEGVASSVVLPGSEGEFGVLPEHVRFLAPLQIGELTITPEGGGQIFAAVSGGFANVDGDKLIVLATTCELADDIDVARAKRAQERAEKLLAAMESDAEAHRAETSELALKRALIRIQVGNHTS